MFWMSWGLLLLLASGAFTSCWAWVAPSSFPGSRLVSGIVGFVGVLVLLASFALGNSWSSEGFDGLALPPSWAWSPPLAIEGWSQIPLITLFLLLAWGLAQSKQESPSEVPILLGLASFLGLAMVTLDAQWLVMALTGTLVMAVIALMQSAGAERRESLGRFVVPQLVGILFLAMGFAMLSPLAQWMQADYTSRWSPLSLSFPAWQQEIPAAIQHAESASLAWFRTESLMFACLCAGLWCLGGGFPFHGGVLRFLSTASPQTVALWLAILPLAVLRIGLLVLGALFSEPLAQSGTWLAPILVMIVLYFALLAMAQTDFRRMIVATWCANWHAAWLGFLSPRPEAQLAAWGLLLMASSGAAATILVMGRLAGSDEERDFDAFAGLQRSRPVEAVALAVGFAVLAGFPPLGGFLSWLVLFSQAANAGLTWGIGLLVAWGLLIWTLGWSLRRWLTGSPRSPVIDSRWLSTLFPGASGDLTHNSEDVPATILLPAGHAQRSGNSGQWAMIVGLFWLGLLSLVPQVWMQPTRTEWPTLPSFRVLMTATAPGDRQP